MGLRLFATPIGPPAERTDADEFTPLTSGSIITLLSFSCNRSCDEADFAFSFRKIDVPPAGIGGRVAEIVTLLPGPVPTPPCGGLGGLPTVTLVAGAWE